MGRRERPVQVNLPNRRTFITKYERAMRDKLPPKIWLRRPYRQRVAPRNRRQQPPMAVQQWDLGVGTILKFAKRIIQTLLVKILGWAALNELPDFHSKGTSKLKLRNWKEFCNWTLPTRW